MRQATLYSLYLDAKPQSADAKPNFNLVRGAIPTRIRNHLWAVNELLRTNLNLDLHNEAIELSGAKALFQSVLELAMPYTLERDDVLHGFLYGREAFADIASSSAFFDDENVRRLELADSIPKEFTEVASLRYLRFRERLNARLNDIGATSEPEIPRLVGQTLRLLNLLRDAWAFTPATALDVSTETNALGVLVFGEPYAHYALQYCSDLNVPAWWSCTATNLHNSEKIVLPVNGTSQRFYRAVLPVTP